MRQIRRDPFARATLVRETVHQSGLLTRPGEAPECAWCEQPGRYAYRWESDDGRSGRSSKTFCSVSCYETYYD
jgi:hypothetical protein